MRAETTMSEKIAEQLSVLYRELAEGRAFSEAVCADLSRAPCARKLKALYIGWSIGDNLDLLGAFRRYWIVDGTGINPDGPLPFEGGTWPKNMTDEVSIVLPHAKFGTDGSRVRFGVRLGPSWYMVREGPLESDGRFDPRKLETLSFFNR